MPMRAPRNVKPVVTKEEAKTLIFDYKDPEPMRRFITESGNILSRERTGLTAKQQRALTRQIKRARHLAMLPFIATV